MSIHPPQRHAEARTRAQPMVPEVQTPSQWPERGRSPAMGAYKLLSTKYFHGVHRGISTHTH
jgi:hypothetical protein